MKFLLVASFPESLINFRGDLIDALVSKGLEVHVAAPDLNKDSEIFSVLLEKGVIPHQIPLQRTGMNPVQDISLLFALYRLMRKINPNFVLGYTIKPVIYGAIAAWMAKVKNRYALITGLGFAFTNRAEKSKKNWVRQLVQWLYSASLSRVHRVIFQNPDDELLFRQLKILPRRVPSLVVNGSGVNVSAYCQSPLPDGANFLLIARLLGDKGIREYAEAARRLKKKYPEAQFSLVGWIDDNPNAISQQELDNWVNEGSIVYLGRLTDVRPAIAKSSVYVLPSYREGTPRTVLEAMSMGRAVITTDAPGCKETVQNGDNGYLVPVQDIDALVEAMEHFIKEPALATHMGQRSREIAEDKYDVHKVNTMMLNEMGVSAETSV